MSAGLESSGLRPSSDLRPDLLDAVMRSMPEKSLVIIDLDLRYRVAYGDAARQIGYGCPEWVGRLARDEMPPSLWSQVEVAVQGAFSGRTSSVVITFDDSGEAFRALHKPLVEAGEITGALVSLRDISAEHRHQQELQEAHDVFELSFAAAPIGKALVATDGHWLKVNPALCRLLGYTEQDLLAGRFQDVTHPDDVDADLTLVQEVLDGHRDGYQMQKRYLRRDQSVVWALLTVSAARTAEGQIRFFISQVQDISDQVAVVDELRRQAEEDALTGLWNRAKLREAADRQPAEVDAALLLVDLDGFKAVNDEHGHATGDRHLREIAAALRRVIRPSDGCARIGGDEFAVLLPGVTSAQAEAVADRIVAEITGLGHGTTASVGIAFRSSGGDFEHWLHLADTAMYAAKHSGGHSYQSA